MADRQNSTENGTLLADDIVTRLRERQRELEFYWPDDDPPLTWVGEAADEIERLRGENEQTWESLLQMKGLLTAERDRVAALQSMLAAYEEQEADRG